MGLGTHGRTGGHTGGRTDGRMGSTHGWATGAAIPKPNLNPASSACVKDPKVHRPASRSHNIGAASPPTSTTSTCVRPRCSSRPGLRDQRIETARRAADPEPMHNRMACACSPPRVSGLLPCGTHSPRHVSWHRIMGSNHRRCETPNVARRCHTRESPMPCRPYQVPLRRLPCSPPTALTTFPVPLVPHWREPTSALPLSVHGGAPVRGASRPASRRGDIEGILQLPCYCQTRRSTGRRLRRRLNAKRHSCSG